MQTQLETIQPAAEPPRDIWYSTRYKVVGDLGYIQAEVDIIAFVAIITHQGNGRMGAEPDDTRSRGQHYAAQIMRDGSLYKVYDIIRAYENGVYEYAATVLIRDFANGYHGDDYIKADALIFNKLTTERPKFERDPTYDNPRSL